MEAPSLVTCHDLNQTVIGTEHIANAELMATSQLSLPFLYGRLKEREPQTGKTYIFTEWCDVGMVICLG